MLFSMLPLSMLSLCRCYSFDVNIFEVDLPVFDVSYFLLLWVFFIRRVCGQIDLYNEQGLSHLIVGTGSKTNIIFLNILDFFITMIVIKHWIVGVSCVNGASGVNPIKNLTLKRLNVRVLNLLMMHLDSIYNVYNLD